VVNDPDGRCPFCISGAVGAAVGAAILCRRNLYVSGGENWGSTGGLAVAAGALCNWSGAVTATGATAVVGAALTGYSAGDVAQRAANYSSLSPEEKRAVQADAALTALAVVGTVAQAARRVRSRKPRRQGGRLGSAATRQHVSDVAVKWNREDGLSQVEVDAFQKNIAGAGGARQGSSYVDITATKMVEHYVQYR